MEISKNEQKVLTVIVTEYIGHALSSRHLGNCAFNDMYLDKQTGKKYYTISSTATKRGYYYLCKLRDKGLVAQTSNKTWQPIEPINQK